MQRFVLPAFVTALALAVTASAAPAFAACAQNAEGRCQSPGAACHPPAGGRCHTTGASSLSQLPHSCRCVSPQPFEKRANAPGQNSCRQRCNARDLTCEANARNFTQRNNCVSRMTTCNSRC